MSRQRILVYGAGGHGKVIIDILERSDRYEIGGVIYDNPGLMNQHFYGYPIVGGLDYLLQQGLREWLILAIGDNLARESLAKRLQLLGLQFVTAIHPASSVARDVVLGPGTVVMANVAINSGAVIGRHVILNTGATIDHDCVIGDFAHISPGAHLGGNVSVGPLAHVGIGASVIEDVTIGARSVIGAGAAVVEDVPADVVAVGVPAHVAVQRERGGDR